MPDRRLQPLLHDLVATVLAPTSALSGTDGQIRAAGVQGVFHADGRVLSQAHLTVDDHELEPIANALTGPGAARFVSLARWLGDPMPDPTVRIDRIRQMTGSGMTEQIQVVSTATVPVRAMVTLHLACDFAPIELVKSGGASTARPARASGPGRLTWVTGNITVTVTGDDATATVAARSTVEGVGDEVTHGAHLAWPVELAPRGRTTLRWRLQVSDPHAVVSAPAAPVEWTRPEVTADDARLVRLLNRSLDDLEALRLVERKAPEDTFLGAGVPWFLTLFGRDSIWAASMLLPLGTDLAGGTLRVLARRQGTRLDPGSGEAPGKIMHELRRHRFEVTANDLSLPPAYYGTVDATLLWVSLLHDAWRWGLPDDQVADLLPHLEAALGWLAEHADADGDGFLEYLDATGRGLANQGWKDSGDGVRFRDGRQAAPPIALAEVQGYAYRSAMHGAALLDAFGRPGGQRWRDYANDLAERFRAHFWVDGPLGAHPAIALDRHKRPVDSLTSNIGHLLGTGILSAKESAAVADVLAFPAMAAGFGLRTMSAQDIGYSPLSYHCGSVWAHDTAIVLAGLAQAGFGAAAAALADGLLAAAEAFDYRLPELFSGDARETVGSPVPYPAACRPQAWSAAAGLAILQAAVGLYPDVPEGRVVLRPLTGSPLGAIDARGLRVAAAVVDVRLDRAGTVTISGLPGGLSVEKRVEADGEPGATHD